MSIVVATASRRRDEVAAAIVERTSRWTSISDKILTPVPVEGARGLLRQIKPAQMIPDVNVDHAGTAGFNRITLTLDGVQYDCEEKALEQIIGRADRGAYDNINFAAVAGERLWNALRIAQEKRVKDLVFKEATFPLTGNTGYDANGAGEPWATVGTDIIGHVKRAIDGIRAQTGFIADHIAMSDATYRNLWRNTGIRSSFGTYNAISIPDHTDAAGRARMAQALGLKECVVGNMPASADYDDAAPSVSDVWGTKYAFVYCRAAAPADMTQPLGNSPAEAGVGLMPFWGTPNGDGAGLMAVEQYPEESGRGDVFRVIQHVDEIVTQAGLGFLIKVAAA